MPCQNLCNADKAACRGKFIAVNAYIKKAESFQINNLPFHFQTLGGEEHTKPKVQKKGSTIHTRQKVEKNQMAIS